MAGIALGHRGALLGCLMLDIGLSFERLEELVPREPAPEWTVAPPIGLRHTSSGRASMGAVAI